MKFQIAWAAVLTQNNALKVALCVTTLTILILSGTVINLALRAPLVIERECWSKAVQTVQNKQTAQEIENFLRFAIPKRFDTDASDAKVFLDSEELGFRTVEQEDLTRKGMKQKVIVDSIQISEKEIVVDTDRILTLGAVRSSIPFLLSVQILATPRTAANPYGLVLEKVTKQEGGKKQ
ncbi:MAG: hypothetical protein HY537_00425 [Deltaproteobacteria bacterium]|nr:hypothetical protein [Deltaproteobacteria bacterium]